MQSQATGFVFFFISKLRLLELQTLTDHFVGFMNLCPPNGLRVPVFINNGYFCFKLTQLEILFKVLPVWIDAHFCVRVGHFSVNTKSPPVIHFTSMPITLPASFGYTSTTSDKLAETKKPLSTGQMKTTVNAVKSFNRPMAPWDEAAGLSFVPRASNSLTCNGQIPHNFPVMENTPTINLSEWHPTFVKKIIRDAKKFQSSAMKSLTSSNRSAQQSLKCTTSK